MWSSVQPFRVRIALLVISGLCCPVSLIATQRAPAHHASTSAGQQSQLAEAESLLQNGQTAQAKASVEEFLRQHPSSVEGYNLLGILCSAEKDYDGALDSFQHALSLNPRSAKTHNNLGNLYASAGKADLAEKEFRKALTIAPSDSEANYDLGLLLLAKDKPASAIPYLQRVHPATVETRMNLVRAYLQANRIAEGLKLASQLSSEKQNDVQRHFTLGVLLASEKQYKPAELEFEKADALKPDTFEIQYNLGQAYLRGKDYAKAELALNRALRLKPQSPEALYLLAQVLNDESRPVDALDIFARAHKLAPENTDIIFLLARISMTQNFFEDAIPLLESGLKLAPQRADLHAALGESYFMSG